MKYRWRCFKAGFVGTFITDAETGESIGIRTALSHLIPYLLGRSY